MDFDGGRSAPYHIKERRGKFIGSLWLGFKGLQWLLTEWATLRSCADLKGFFRFYRNGYSILEFSCLQNHHGRFVELAEYHGGAQRGGLRIPEGFRGKGWDRFAYEIEKFFLGKAALAQHKTGKFQNFRNGRLLPNRNMHDTRDFPAKISQSTGIDRQKDSGLLPNLPRATMDPDAPRPTRKFKFNWNPNTKTLRINKWEGERKKAEWVGLKQKAQGLRQVDKQAQGPDPVASREEVGPS